MKARKKARRDSTVLTAATRRNFSVPAGTDLSSETEVRSAVAARLSSRPSSSKDFRWASHSFCRGVLSLVDAVVSVLFGTLVACGYDADDAAGDEDEAEGVGT